MFAGMMFGAVGWGTCKFITMKPRMNEITDDGNTRRF